MESDMQSPRTCSLLSISFISIGVALFGADAPPHANSFRLATYNLENYLLTPVGSRPAKSAQSRAQIRSNLLALKTDVLALQEVGGAQALTTLRASLRAGGLDYPYWERITGFDTNIQVAVLSRFPIVARRPHTNDAFLLMGRRFRVSRGFLEVDIQVRPSYRFTLITTHLKSRRPVGYADEAELREQEAIQLREKIEQRLEENPQVNLVLLGDLNDLKNSRTLRLLIGRGRRALVDTRPAERNGDDQPNPHPRHDPRHIAWTHYYGAEDTYSRIDYILLSPGLAREWLPQETFVQTVPNWGVASDHRAVTAAFISRDQ
jgi:endonuclease/exonuclease/phosphatase family metal-dependent hydrolase